MRKVTERLQVLIATSEKVGEARADGDAEPLRSLAMVSRGLRNLIVAEAIAAED